MERSPTLTQAFQDAYRRGQAERQAAHRAIAAGLAELKSALEAANLGFAVEATDYDGLFVRMPNAKLGWWAYLAVNTAPQGLSYTVRAGFGPKNEPEALRDALPESIHPSAEAGVEALAAALERGLYYLGTLRR